MREWNPSFDFRLFDVGWISPLQANEFGAAASFRATDPTSFVDYSLNQLAGLLNPRAAYPYIQNQLPAVIDSVPFDQFFQGASDTPEAARERLRRLRDRANEVLGEGEKATFPQGRPQSKCGTTKCIWWEKWLGRKDGECCHDVLHSDDSSVGTVNPSGERINWWEGLPSGAGVFLVGLAALIFILLFVRR